VEVAVPAPPGDTEPVIEYTRTIAATPETVFEYFTDPEKMVQWMGTEATLDPRPGGVCRINPTGHAVMSGRFLEVEPPHRLVLSWGWETELFSTPPQSTLVEVTLTPTQEGTLLRLMHRRLDPSAHAFHRAGWDHYIPRLAGLASGGPAVADPWRDAETAANDLRNAGVSAT
jgi:uncharacterized protein YndB with AHSA1/START domain